MERRPTPTPPEPVDDTGTPRYGVFASPFKTVNLDAARLSFGGVRLPAALSRPRLKEWQHYWLATDDIFLGFAFVDAKYTRTCFAYLFDRKDGTLVEHSVQNPFVRTKIPRALWDERGSARATGFHIDVHNHLEAGLHELSLDVAPRAEKPGLRARLRLAADPVRHEPLVVVLPIGGHRAMYSHKALLPAEGEVQVGERILEIAPGEGHVLVDVHKAHYPFRTWWRWATFAGHDTRGRVIGLNLTRNVCLEPETYNECAVWVDGRLERLAPARIEHGDDMLAPWTVRTEDGAVDLTFLPQGERAENIVLGPVMSRFHQPFGTYEGTITLGSGEVLELADAAGVAEDHRTRW